MLQGSRTACAWRIIDGIPRFVTDEHLESFGHQWTKFDVAHDEEDRATRAQTLATQGFFVMVSIGADGKPATVNRPGPRVEPQAESRGPA